MKPVLLSATVACSFIAFNLSAADLTEYSAKYLASANGLKASATRTLERTSEGHYQLSNFLVAEFAGKELASLNETTQFSLRGETPQPHAYNYLLTGISQEARTILFNWDADLAVSTEDLESWPLQLIPDTQDPLSYQAALQLVFKQENLTDISWPIVDGDKIEVQQFRVEGEEILETPVGSLRSVKLVRVRQDDSKSTTIWLAKDWAYLLTKIEQVSSSGFKIVLELESAVVDGVNVGQ